MLYQPLNQEKIRAYFAEMFPDRADLALDGVRRSYPGMSRETWWVDVGWNENGAHATERFVVRLDPPGGSLSMSPLSFESAVYKALHGTAVPVPRLIVHEDRAEWLLEGRDFSVREWTEGEVEPAVLGETGEAAQAAKDAIIHELMDKLVALHALDWREIGLGDLLVPPSDPANCAREEIERLLADQAVYGIEPMPLMREIGRWMVDNPPPVPGRIVMRKENNGIGEEIWQDGRIVGMCDWEGASLGDPALDIAVAFNTTVKYGNEEATLAYYNARVPHPVEMAAVRWYGMFWAFKAANAMQNGLGGFRRGTDRRVQLLTLGLLVPYVVQKQLADAVGF